MPSFPLPSNESERIAALQRCGVLDTPPERLFDDVVLLASQICGTPIALVSLIDSTRQWFKAQIGLDFQETSRGSSLCAHAIVAKGPMVVRDALADPRFVEHPLVTGSSHIRFYAAVPLVVGDGFALGTVCVMDHAPRELTSAQVASLEVLARRTSAELTLRSRLDAIDASRDGAPADLRDTTRDNLQCDDEGPGSHLQRRHAAHLPVAPGSLVAERYRIERLIGAGGMGVVAAAMDTRRGVRVAIKFMLPSALAQAPALRRFAREAQVLLTLDSEHVARVLNFGQLAEGAPFIVMEYLDGMDLAAHLSAMGRLSVPVAVDLMLQACTAIQAAHDEGILHRDLKPANLFLARTPDGGASLKVLDFGISKLAESGGGPLETALTGDATELGSPSYMSPEQMIGAADVDVRSDVWSLGIVLFELLAGRPPFTGPNRIEVCVNVLSSVPPSLHELRPELPAGLVAIVERCLERSPERRYQSVRELAQALTRLNAFPGALGR